MTCIFLSTLPILKQRTIYNVNVQFCWNVSYTSVIWDLAKRKRASGLTEAARQSHSGTLEVNRSIKDLMLIACGIPHRTMGSVAHCLGLRWPNSLLMKKFMVQHACVVPGFEYLSRVFRIDCILSKTENEASMRYTNIVFAF